jgi:hypothetical protein
MNRCVFEIHAKAKERPLLVKRCNGTTAGLGIWKKVWIVQCSLGGMAQIRLLTLTFQHNPVNTAQPKPTCNPQASIK